MAQVLRHRGPDGSAIWRENGVGFAHNRLAVIDPTPRGAQPMIDDSGRYVLNYNGEIYGYDALRAELEAMGDRFHSGSDTEVLLNGWRRWGEGVLDRIDGMYAFAIYDRVDRRLFLARDRFGEKPLYYAVTNTELTFGSEIKAIVSDGRPRTPDLRAINHYLSFQYVPGPWTAFEGVDKLPPATLIEVAADGVSEPRRYWTAPSPAPLRSSVSSAALREELLERLRASVRSRMVADVPVGAFLSGGVDSSAVVALMSEIGAGHVKTFSIGFEDPSYDERSHARGVAERFGADHHEAVLTPACLDEAAHLAWHYGEPFADPSALATHAVSRLAREQVKVSLSGDGGDELFLGYGRYADMAAFDTAGASSPPLAAPARAAAAAMPDALARHRPFGGIRRRLRNYGATPAQRYEPAIGYFFAADKAAGYGPALHGLLRPESFSLLDHHFAQAPTLMSGAAIADLHSYLPDDILTKVDVAAMAVSLESRAPFLSRDLAEFGLSLPPDARAPGGVLKGLLKDALEPLLPRELLHRPKMGFGLPLEPWLRGPWLAHARDLLLDGRFATRGLFQPAYVSRLVEEHAAGRQHHTRLWALMMLETWYRVWIDPPAPPLSA